MFPTFQDPQMPLHIIISKREMKRAEDGSDLEVLGNVAHEIVHYFILLSDHNWDHTQPEFLRRNNAKEHCDPEFMRLVRHFGTFVWNAYHSNYTVRAINQTVSRSCWEEGQILNWSPLVWGGYIVVQCKPYITVAYEVRLEMQNFQGAYGLRDCASKFVFGLTKDAEQLFQLRP